MIAAKLRVQAVGAYLAARLGAAASLPGRPHSVYEHAINFTGPDGMLLALHGPWHLAAPFAIALPTWDQDLSAGDLILDLEGAQRVDLAIRPAAEGDDAARDLLDEALARSASAPLAPGLDTAAGRAARSAMGVAIRRRDAAAFLEAARGLVGLGEASPRPGDDYLVGALARSTAWARAGPPARRRSATRSSRMRAGLRRRSARRFSAAVAGSSRAAPRSGRPTPSPRRGGDRPRPHGRLRRGHAGGMRGTLAALQPPADDHAPRSGAASTRIRWP
jgi:hypothetical protein